jgi:hypothetical protein
MPGRGQPWKPSSLSLCGFPPLPTALGKRCAFPTFPQRLLRFFSLSIQNRKDPSRPIPHLPLSGSSFDENMLHRSNYLPVTTACSQGRRAWRHGLGRYRREGAAGSLVATVGPTAPGARVAQLLGGFVEQDIKGIRSWRVPSTTFIAQGDGTQQVESGYSAQLLTMKGRCPGDTFRVRGPLT